MLAGVLRGNWSSVSAAPKIAAATIRFEGSTCEVGEYGNSAVVKLTSA
jgi:hypothetical protein